MSIDTLPFAEGPEIPPDIDDEEWMEETCIPFFSFLNGCCSFCNFSEDEIFWKGDVKDKEDAEEKLRQLHVSTSSSCPGQLQFGVS